MDNSSDIQESRMSLEEAIDLTKQQLEKEPDRLKDEQDVINKYRSIFSLNNIQNLTADDFISFLLYKNNKHWHSINRYSGKITANMDKLRSTLKEVLDESRPINERLDAVKRDGASHIFGLGRAVLTPILLVAYPEKYAVYNEVTENAMKYFGIYPDFSAEATFGERYAKINGIIKDIAKKNNLSLWQMDHVWDLLDTIRVSAEQDNYLLLLTQPDTKVAQFSIHNITNIS